MRIRRTIPPTAAPIKLIDLCNGFIGLLCGGSNGAKFERELEEQFGVTRAFCVSSGTAALALILLALKELSDRRQVIIPAYTCFSVPSAILSAGLGIVPCDVDPLTLDFDYDHLEKVMNKRTLCVVATHLFGLPSDLDRLGSRCRENGTFVIEDAAQAMGGEYKGRMLGTIGDAGFYSLGRGKNITAGSGGIIVTRSDPIAAALSRRYAGLKKTSFMNDVKNFLQVAMMSFLIRPNCFWLPSGIPFLTLGQTFFLKTFPIQKLSTRRTSLLRHWRTRLVESNQVRTQTATKLYENLRGAGVTRRPVPYLRLPLIIGDGKTREFLFAQSQEKGLGLSLMYPTPVNQIEELKGMFDGETYPAAEEVAERILALPTHHLMTEQDKAAILALFRSTELPSSRASLLNLERA
jgi:perosamine synthetase